MLQLNAFYKTATDIIYLTSYDVTTNRYYGVSPRGKVSCRIKRSEESHYAYQGSFAFFQQDDILTYMRITYPEYYV